MNTSSSYHATIGRKKKAKAGGSQKLPAALSARMRKPKQEQQEVMPTWLSAYGKRRRSKMRGI